MNNLDLSNRMQYPNEIEGISPEQIASTMIPDGAHNMDDGVTTFILRKNTTKNLFDEEIKSDPTSSISASNRSKYPNSILSGK